MLPDIFSQTIALLDDSNFFFIITTSMDGNYSYVNKTYQRAFNYIEQEMVGKPYHITMHPDDTNVCVQVSTLCFADPTRSFPATIRKHDGKGGYVVTQWEYRAILDENAEPQGVFCLGHDITQLRLANAEIAHKKQLLNEIGWNQSHLIRKPVANIIGLINILDKMDLDQHQRNIYA